MAPDHRGRVEAVEDAAVDHAPGPAQCFLGRLEDERVPPRERRAPRRQDLGDTEHGRGVGVVAAGVHDAVGLRGHDVSAALGDREGVDVCAEQDRRTGSSALEHGDRAGLGRTGPRLEPERLEPGADDVGRAVLGEAQLGVAVEVVARRHHRGGRQLDLVVELLEGSCGLGHGAIVRRPAPPRP